MRRSPFSQRDIGMAFFMMKSADLFPGWETWIQTEMEPWIIQQQRTHAGRTGTCAFFLLLASWLVPNPFLSQMVHRTRPSNRMLTDACLNHSQRLGREMGHGKP